MKTLAPDIKAKLESFLGIKLTAAMEDRAVALQEAGAIDWASLIQQFIAAAPTIIALAKVLIPAILSLIGYSPTPAPSPPPVPAANPKYQSGGVATTTVTCCPEHHSCCQETFHAAVASAVQDLEHSCKMACCLTCQGCDPACKCCFQDSICNVLKAVCVYVHAAHCLDQCCT